MKGAAVKNVLPSTCDMWTRHVDHVCLAYVMFARHMQMSLSCCQYQTLQSSVISCLSLA